MNTSPFERSHSGRTHRLVFILLILCACSRPPEPAADLLLRNARVYVSNSTDSRAAEIAIADGKILAVGDASEVGRWADEHTERIDLGGKLVLPAFRDAHVHPLMAGLRMAECELSGAETVAEIEARIRQWLTDNPDAPWLIGGGWELPLFPDANPHKDLLDALVSDRPAILRAADGHSTWVNSAALHAAGITKNTPDPPRGRIERDPRTQEPTGTLREAASQLVARLQPPIGAAERQQALRRALKHLNALGIVAFQDASADSIMLEAYLTADREGWLSARVRVALRVDPARGTEQLPALQSLRKRRSPRVRPDTVKFFLDGVLESQTAAVLEPYIAAGGAPTRGTANFDSTQLRELVRACDAAGFQIHMHAIGDAAIRMGLDALEQARATNEPRDARPHLAHIQLFHPDDIPRFAELGAIANFQPLWAFADEYITQLTEPRLGPERSRWLYPIDSMLRSGAHVVAGSDWPVSSANPLEGIEVGVTRCEPGDSTSTAWIPQERATLAAMIDAYTIGAAYGDFDDSERGSIEVGKWADLVVLDRDIFSLPPHEIHAAQVVWTMLEGETVWVAAVDTLR